MPNAKGLYAASVRSVNDAIKQLGQADIVVGIPSYKEVDSIAHVVRQADAGLREHFPDVRGVIVNADNNSPDGTREAFLATKIKSPNIYVSTPKGARGKGNNFWNIFQIAKKLNTKAIAVVDADLVSITPQWIRSLARPILDGKADYITPVYSRNEYDGTITNNICYPLIYSLLGCDLRQPIGGDFGLSTKLSNQLLEETWLDTTRDYGIDVYLTSCALLGDFVIAQTHLGSKIHKPSAPKLGPMFTQVITTLFTQLIDNRDKWDLTGTVQSPRTFKGIPTSEPQGLAVDYKAIKRGVLTEYRARRSTLEAALSKENFTRVDALMQKEKMAVTAQLWCDVVFDLLQAFANRSPSRRGSIVESLKPLYFARAATFYRETLDKDHAESEAQIIAQAKVFRKNRQSLIDRLT